MQFYSVSSEKKLKCLPVFTKQRANLNLELKGYFCKKKKS